MQLSQKKLHKPLKNKLFENKISLSCIHSAKSHILLILDGIDIFSIKNNLENTPLSIILNFEQVQIPLFFKIHLYNAPNPITSTSLCILMLRGLLANN